MELDDLGQLLIGAKVDGSKISSVANPQYNQLPASVFAIVSAIIYLLGNQTT